MNNLEENRIRQDMDGTLRRITLWTSISVVATITGIALLASLYGTHLVGTPVMGPAINAGETVVVDERAPSRRGDIVVVEAWGGATFTVRVIGVGGDVVVCCDENKKLRVNNEVVFEPYAHGETDTFGKFSVTVPQNRIFVLGDSRSVAVDSRSHLDEESGTLSVDQIRGPVVAVASPVWRVRPLTGIANIPLLVLGTALTGAGLIALIITMWSPTKRQIVGAYHTIGNRLRRKKT